MLGGGNFVTEAYPTNFHSFAPKRILLDGQSTDDYKEVTPAERSAIEAADAKWEEPSDAFKEICSACGFPYNQHTGYFEGNDIYNLTAKQMGDIISFGRIQGLKGGVNYDLRGLNSLRTNIPNLSSYPETALYIHGCSVLEVLSLNDLNIQKISYCPKLRRIIGGSGGSKLNSTCYPSEVFDNLPNLEEIDRLTISTGNWSNKVLNLSTCPKLSLATFQKIKNNSGTAFSITVHPDVYAKITDESNEEWHALLAAAAEKNITFATT